MDSGPEWPSTSWAQKPQHGDDERATDSGPEWPRTGWATTTTRTSVRKIVWNEQNIMFIAAIFEQACFL